MYGHKEPEFKGPRMPTHGDEPKVKAQTNRLHDDDPMEEDLYRVNTVLDSEPEYD